MTTPHRIINPSSLAPPVGYSHVVEAAGGRTIYIGGQAAHNAGGNITTADLVGQFDAAAANVVAALDAAGARPEHLVSIHIYVTDAAAYRSSLKQVGEIYRKHFGRHYPAVSLFEVSGLFDEQAKVEVVATAVIPD